jgi:hypothetical protein
LRGRDDKPTEALLLKLFKQWDSLVAIKADPSGKDIVHRLAQIMATGPKGARQTLIDSHAMLSAEELPQAFIAARRTLPPAKVFELFSPYLTNGGDDKKKKGDTAAAKREAICDMVVNPWQWRYTYHYSTFRDELDDEESEAIKQLDPRWLDVAVKLGHIGLVQSLARPGHAAANKLLEQAFAEKLKKTSNLHEALGVLATMVKVQHPTATDSFLTVLGKNTKATYWGWYTYYLGPLIPDLPKEALPRIEEALPKLPEKAIDQLLEHVQALKAKV